MVMLTTVDNPFDPITQFDDWYSMMSRKAIVLLVMWLE